MCDSAVSGVRCRRRVRLVSAAPWGELSPALVERLAADPDWGVRFVIACRADLTPALVERLIADPDVRAAIARRANLT